MGKEMRLHFWFSGPKVSLSELNRAVYEIDKEEKVEIHVQTADGMHQVADDLLRITGKSCNPGTTVADFAGIPVRLSLVVPADEVWLVYPDRLANLAPNAILRVKRNPA